jgi:tripartite-type tricarboxylate transporter receptor subunit TctC
VQPPFEKSGQKGSHKHHKPTKTEMSMHRVLISIALVVTAAAALAQDYPAKPIRIIIASSAGGPPDLVTRPLAELLRQELRQPIIVENIPAANGITAAVTVGRASPDGYTLMVAAAPTMTLNPALFTKLPYDSRKDFAPIAMLAHFVGAIVVHPGIPANTMRELIDLARAKPDSINFGTGGRSQLNNLYAEWMRNAMNVPFYNVPYKENPRALAAVVAGEVQTTYFALGGAMIQAKAGKVRVLALNAEKRVPAYPDLPTVREQGVDLVLPNWLALFAPAGTPRPIVQQLNAAINKTSGTRDYIDRILWGQGLVREAPAGESPEAVARYIQSDLANYERVIREARIPPE